MMDYEEFELNKYKVYKGDELLVTGTAEECAGFLNIKKSTIYWHLTDSAKKIREKRKYPQHAIRVEKV